MQEFETEIKTGDGTMDVFVCHPEQDGPHPAVILYMDAPGIREELRDMARRIGTVGYTVLLPNMYYRTGREGHYGYDLARIRDDDSQREKMFQVMNSLTNADVVDDTKGMLAFIDSYQPVVSGPIGCVGYCMSGQFVMSVGSAYPDRFAAVAAYHGVKIIFHRRGVVRQGELFRGLYQSVGFLQQFVCRGHQVCRERRRGGGGGGHCCRRC